MDIFSTNVLNGVVRYLPQPVTFLLDRFFPMEQTETSEEIHFDVENGKRRIAPFVSPLVAGRIVEGQGYVAKTFKPAYVKDKRIFDPNRPMKRAMGERIGGDMSPQARLEAMVRTDLEDQVKMVNRRLEVMASEVLRLGQVTVSGELYPTQVVSYGRPGGHTVTLAGAARWGQAGIKPLDNLETWATTVLQASGATITDWVMDVEAWKLLRVDADFQKLLDRFRGNATMEKITQEYEGASLVAQVPPWNIWVYQGWYVNDAGAEVPLLPANTVIGGSPLIEGVRAFGAIRDEEAGYQAMPYFAKSWVEKDPAARFLMTQSAPLVVPYRPAASFCATVN